MENFSKNDTILAVRLNSETSHKGFLVKSINSRSNISNSNSIFKMIYLVKEKESQIKKFYDKGKGIKIYTTRMVLVEKIKFINK